MSNLARTALVIAGFTLLAIAMTWPLSVLSPVSVPDSDDVYFSIWRISWVAHQLPGDPARLFDANIFYPAKGTLAFSDAMLLVGILASPLIWLGVEPAIAHNLLLVTAIVSSAVAAFYLARRLGVSSEGAALAGIIFGFAPYRFAHIGHLELQWVVWMPLAMIAFDKIVDAPTRWNGIALGLCVVAQTLSSIYYGVFLCVYLAAAAAIALVRSPRRSRVGVSLGFAALPLILVALIYGPPYARTRAALGSRDIGEQQQFSAAPADFMRVPPFNAVRGEHVPSVAPDERSLYPGAVSVALAAVALFPPVSASSAVYAALGALAFEGALGTNGHVFPVLQRIVPAMSSLRSPARFGVLLLLSLAVLAGIGLSKVNRRWPHYRMTTTAIALAVCLLEFWSAPIGTRLFDTSVSPADQFLAQQPLGTVVLELPIPSPDSLWLYETTYQLRSIHHWQPLVNGYSGFAPENYRRSLDELKTFPSAESTAYLQNLGVRFVILNRAYYSDDSFQALVAELSEHPELWLVRSVGNGAQVVAELKQTH